MILKKKRTGSLKSMFLSLTNVLPFTDIAYSIATVFLRGFVTFNKGYVGKLLYFRVFSSKYEVIFMSNATDVLIL